MPFSRSRSWLSSTRSSTAWLARNAPLCQSMASTSVVFPWSTWATIATFLMSSRAAIATPEGRAYAATRSGTCSATICGTPAIWPPGQPSARRDLQVGLRRPIAPSRPARRTSSEPMATA